MATAVIAFGVLLLVVSCLGCATAKFKNPCFAIPFGLTNLIFGLILLILAFVGMGSAALTDVFFNQMCPYNKLTNPRETLSGFDLEYNNNIDKQMCSEACPCFIEEANKDTTWPSSLTPAQANKYRRTFDFKEFKKTTTKPGTSVAISLEENDWDANGYEAEYTPFGFTTVEANGQANFASCYKNVLKEKKDYKKKSFQNKFEKYATGSAFDTIKSLED